MMRNDSPQPLNPRGVSAAVRLLEAVQRMLDAAREVEKAQRELDKVCARHQLRIVWPGGVPKEEVGEIEHDESGIAGE